MFPFIVCGVILLLILLAAEIYLRIRYKNLLWMQVYPQVYMPDEDLGYRYRPNIEGEIRIPGIHRRFRTNNRGFHGRDFVQDKPPGTQRIAIVGPSNTTGIWSNGQGQNFPEMLERALQERGHKVDVMNFGIDGRFRAIHQLRVVENEVALYRPDRVLMEVEIPFVYGAFHRDVYRGYVMIYNSENELSRQWCQAMIDRVTKHKFAIALYYVSFIFRAATRYYMNRYNNARTSLIRVFVENRIQAPDIQLLPYSVKKSVEALQALRDKLAEQGGELIMLAYFPNPYLREITTKYGLDYLELNVPPVPAFVHDRDGHYRHEGHVEIAKQLTALLLYRDVMRQSEATAEPIVAEMETPVSV